MRKKLIPAVLAVVIVSGCAGIFGRVGEETREHALLPAVEQAWPGVYASAARGVNDATASGDITAEVSAALFVRMGDWETEVASDSTSVNQILALAERDWMEVQFYALRGIASRQDAGEVGPNVATELRERVMQFDEALVALGEPSNPE